MSYLIEKDTGDLVISGWEKGIAPSPHQGIGNMQGVNIDTETGEVMCSFARVQQSQPGDTATPHTFNALDTSHLETGFTLTQGVWITISASTISGLAAGDYYVAASNGTPTIAATSVQLSTYYGSAILTGFGATGTATFTLKRAMGLPIASATELFKNGNTQYARYYILDSSGLIWVFDTYQNAVNPMYKWFLPDTTLGSPAPNASGIAVLNGWLLLFSGNTIWGKSTVNLGAGGWTSAWIMMSPQISPVKHFAFVGHQGKAYYTDGNFIGSIFPNTSLLTGGANIQSFAQYSSPTAGDNTKGTIYNLISGSLPTLTPAATRVPAVFFPGGFNTAMAGTNPTALTQGTVYYIEYSLGVGTGTFQVFAALTGGSALDITTGASGSLYFNTFYPTSASGKTAITFTPQRLNLPTFETASSMAEVGNTVIIGTSSSSYLYPWNQVDVLPSDLIPLPEVGVVTMITVNNMAYVFAGNKGNIYVTNGSTASRALTVPDYTAGIEGTPSSYIEPYFTWGGAAYIRGRIYFSILDQTPNKAGNCGGIWSFLPTENMYIAQNVGVSLCLENQSSYGTYNGYAPIIIASQTQNALGPQYFAAWESSISSPTYGIDFTGTTPQSAIIETDAIPIGTLLKKMTFQQIEYKLSSPADLTSSVALYYRVNLTDSYATCGTPDQELANLISGMFPTDFQGAQWVQYKIVLTPLTSPYSSFMRFKELRMR